ncbi:MAG: nitroreductase family protein [Dysgonamonadaceae bacterium]|jgi:nitroreductase|nr:nitroreductase family protein [Dysgonamonadaceae bacterium]
MDLLEIISKRRSVRQFLPDHVETEKIDYLLECARLAPSAVNAQPWKFLVVKSPEKKALLHQCYNRDWFAVAPVYILALGDTGRSWKRKADGKDHCDIDVTIAFEHIVLAATEKGLGTCWVCNFDVELCYKLFDLPAGIIPVAITPIGYPAHDLETVTNRKTIREITEII